MMLNWLMKKPALKSTLKPAPRCTKVAVSLKTTPTPVEFSAPNPDTTLVFSVVDDTLWVRAKREGYQDSPALAMYMTGVVDGVSAEYEEVADE